MPLHITLVANGETPTDIAERLRQAATMILEDNEDETSGPTLSYIVTQEGPDVVAATTQDELVRRGL